MSSARSRLELCAALRREARAGLSNRALQPAATWTQPVSLNPARERLPKLLIACSLPLAQIRQMIADGHPWFAEMAGLQWSFMEVPTGHWPMFSVPDRPADVLHDLLATR